MNDQLIRCELEPVQPSQTPAGTVKVVLLVIHLLYSVIGSVVFYCNKWMLSGGMCIALMYICVVYLYIIYLVAKGQLHESCLYLRFRYYFYINIHMGVGHIIVICVSIKNLVEKTEYPDFDDSCASIFTSSCPLSFLLAYEFWCHKKERNNTVLLRNGTAYFF